MSRAEKPAVNPEKNPDFPNLNVGGTNKGGTGRPTSEIRERCRGSFNERIPILEEIADSKESNANDRIKAIDTLAKYGGVQQIDLTNNGGSFDPVTVYLPSNGRDDKKTD